MESFTASLTPFIFQQYRNGFKVEFNKRRVIVKAWAR